MPAYNKDNFVTIIITTITLLISIITSIIIIIIIIIVVPLCMHRYVAPVGTWCRR